MVWPLLWLLTGCSTLRVAYDTGPTLAWWWIDGYGDFTGEPGHARQGRHPTLVRLASYDPTARLRRWLAGTRGKIGDSITPAQVCRCGTRARLLDPAIDRAC
jgi:hypothetical protein